MAKSDKHIEETRHKDITQQAYRGTNEAISGLGYGAVETKAGLLAGVPVGAVVGGIAYGQVDKAQQGINKTLTGGISALSDHKGIKGFLSAVPRWTLRAANWILNVSRDTAKHAFDHLPKDTEQGIKKILGKKANLRFQGASTGATLGAAAGFLVASVTGAAHGTKVASDGRKQFNDAKDEIRKLRQENSELEGKYEALQDAHKTAITEISQDEVPSTAIDAASIDSGKRRDDQTLAALPELQIN